MTVVLTMLVIKETRVKMPKIEDTGLYALHCRVSTIGKILMQERLTVCFDTVSMPRRSGEAKKSGPDLMLHGRCMVDLTMGKLFG